MWCALYGRDWLILNLRIQPMKRRLPPLPYTHTKLVLYSTGCDWLSGIASLSVRCVECVCCNLANNLGPQNARRPHMHAWRPYSRPQLYINVGNQPNILSQGSVCAAAASAWRRASGVLARYVTRGSSTAATTCCRAVWVTRLSTSLAAAAAAKILL